MKHRITLIAATLMLMGSVGSALHVMPVQHPTRNCVYSHWPHYTHCHR